MKRIELYYSMSGDVHLYEIGFEQPAMTEIARGKFGKKLGFGYLLGENEESVSFYQSMNDKWRVVPVHTTDVGVLFGEIVYCRKDVWYAYLDGKEILLGERKRLDAVSFFRCGSSSYESYFIRSGEETFVLSIITPQGKLMQKEYPGSLKENRQVILAPLGDGCFDAYQEARQLIGLTEKGKPYFEDDEGNIYFWSESKYCWKRLPLRRCVVIADNAVVQSLEWRARLWGSYYMYKLYKIDADVGYEAVRRGKVDFSYKKPGIKIDGWIYAKDCETDLLDFEHPRKSRWLKIKSFFGLGKK